MARFLPKSAVAVLLVLTLTSPSRAQDVPDLVDPKWQAALIVDRLGRLPGELVKAKKTDAEFVEAMFLAALGRLPLDKEKEATTKFLASAKDRERAGRDLAWALVNTKEFITLRGLGKDVEASLKFLRKLTDEWGKEKDKDKK